ncbi:RUN and FYVE domain-containing protein 4 isoform X1 [Pogona vitticeps]
MESSRELLHVIKDLKNVVTELNANYHEKGLPVTDGSQELQQFCAQLEFLLQYDLKEKRNLFGQKKDYWDFLSRILTKLHGGTHAGVQHVTFLDKLKTPVGRGRAFIRYCLVHQQLAETLQLCFMEPQVTSEWYYARSPFLDQKLWLDILSSLYELDGVAFHLALCRADLDVAWPMGSEALPRCTVPSTSLTQVEKPTSEVISSHRDPVSNQTHGGSLRTKEHYGPKTPPDDLLRPELENSVEKWVGVWRRRKNSLLQMGSLLNLNYFMERQVQLPVADKEGQRLSSELKVLQLKEQSKEQPSNISSTQELYSLLSQPQHYLCTNVERPPQVMSEGGSCWKQKDLRILTSELDDLRMKLAQQQEENTSLRQTFSEENQALKEQLAKHEEQYREKMDEQEKQQQEMAKVVESIRKAEEKIASLTSECQEARDKKRAAERGLEEAEQRLSFLEAERRKHLADIKAQELRHQLMVSRCQGLQEKLKACEENLERRETQASALNSHHDQLGMTEELSEGTRYKPAETMLEKSLLREKLERNLAEIEGLERERETLMETLVSREQSLMFTKLEVEDLQKKLLVCQEHVVILQTSLEEQEKALRNKEAGAQDLQRNLQDQSAQFQKALGEKLTLEAQLQEVTSKKSQLEAQIAEEQGRYEKTLQELKGQLGAFGKELAGLQEDKQQLQATLQQLLEEREALVKHAESTAATLEGQTQEVTQLRSELEAVKATSQALQKTLQEENETVTSALRQQCLQLKNQVEQLEEEKMQATSRAKKLLEQCWEWPVGDEEATSPGMQKGTSAEKNTYGIVRSCLTDKDVLQADELHGLERPVKKSGSAKHRTEAHGKCLTSHLDLIIENVRQARQMLQTKENTTKHLMEQLSRCQQEKKELQLLLEKSHQESEEKEKKNKQELLEERELIYSMKKKLLELLREKDALWQKTESLASAEACTAPQNSGMCTLCKKDFRLMSRRYQCSLCRNTVCHACSVSSGHKERCCLPCHQKRNGQGT